MLATLTEDSFDDPNWIFEIKFDGYRALAHIAKKKVGLYSRNAKLFNARFPTLVEELKKISFDCVLDGEIVILDERGRSHFQLLQNYEESHKGNPDYYLFDILSFKGKDLRQLPLKDRREFLKELLGKYKFKHIHFSESIEKRGKALFEKAKKAGLEGIIAKRKESRYHSTRSRDWLKIKSKMRQEVVIGGFTKPRGSRKYFGALLIGVYEKGKLIYSGHVGGGFNEKLLKQIYSKMVRLVRKSCPFKDEPHPNAPVVWIQPKLVCEVAFTEWTKDKILRQPIFQGMRTDKSASQVRREV